VKWLAYSFKSSIRSPRSSKAMDPESSMYRTTSNKDSLTFIVSGASKAVRCKTYEIGSEFLGHSPFSGNLVESTGRCDLGSDHIERSWWVERLDVLLAV